MSDSKKICKNTTSAFKQPLWKQTSLAKLVGIEEDKQSDTQKMLVLKSDMQGRNA
jgi:hypothetical protein